MTNPACRNCKHWQPLTKEFCSCSPNEPCDCSMCDDDSYWHFRYSPNSGLCGKACMQADKGDPFDDDMMFVADSSNYRACLVTKGEFFCAHFEAKPATETAP